MTPDGLVVVCGALLAVAGFGAPLLSRAFCTRNCPVGVRHWRDVALGLMGARLASGEGLIGDGQWWVAALLVNLAVAQAVVMGFALVYALRDGERCT